MLDSALFKKRLYELHNITADYDSLVATDGSQQSQMTRGFSPTPTYQHAATKKQCVTHNVKNEV